MNKPKIHIVHLGHTPIPGTADRNLSVGKVHVKRLEAVASAQAVYVTREDMLRALIDKAFSELKV